VPPAQQQWARLADLAVAARELAYAPYSGFRVGAAVACQDGCEFSGANVENGSDGLTICAERVAVFKAVEAGARRIVAVAVAAEPAAWPCGACLQVLAEFASRDCIILSIDGERQLRSATLGELLPRAFDAAFLREPSQ